MKIIANTFATLAITGLLISIITMAVMPDGSWDVSSDNFEPLYQPLFVGGILLAFFGFIGVCFTYEHLN